MFDDPIARFELLAAAEAYADAVQLAEETATAAREAEKALEEADVAVVEATNTEWEAQLGEEGATRQELGFHAGVADPPSEAFDLAVKSRAAEFSKLRYHQKRAVMLNAGMAATNASEAAQAAEKRLLGTAKTRPVDSTVETTALPVDPPTAADQAEVTA